jgi:thiosulfate reductase cytochrome b subunit
MIAAVMFLKKKNEKFWITFAAVLMLVIFLIPHSVLGSELDYQKIDKAKTKVENVK